MFATQENPAELSLLWFQGTVQSYHGLLAARIFLGVAESGQYPGVTYYLTMWYAPQDLGFVS